MAITDILAQRASQLLQERQALTAPDYRPTDTLLQIARMNEERHQRENLITEAKQRMEMADAARTFALKKIDEDRKYKEGQQRLQGEARQYGYTQPDDAAIPEQYVPFTADVLEGRKVRGTEAKERKKTETAQTATALLRNLPKSKWTLEGVMEQGAPAEVTEALLDMIMPERKEARLGESAAATEEHRKNLEAFGREKFEYQKQRDTDAAALAAERLDLAEESLALAKTKEERIAAKQKYDTAIARIKDTQKDFLTGGEFGKPKVLNEDAWAMKYPEMAKQWRRAKIAAGKFDPMGEEKPDPNAKLDALLDSMTPEEIERLKKGE